MSGGFLTRYAQHSFPPEYRANVFVDGEPRLTWTSLFFDAFPNADIYLVGGTVRDALLGRIPDDIDLVIRNVPIDTLENWLRSHGAFEVAGKRFGTFKFSPHGCASRSPIDIALPRKEFIGDEHYSGRRDLEIQFDPTLPIKSDLARRDFTINAIAYDIHRGKLIDPYGGLDDLHHGLIRAVLEPGERFFEDATRILRGLRFASQLGFGIEHHTWHAIKDFIGLTNKTVMLEDGTHGYVIPREAIGKEFLLGFVAHPAHTISLWSEAGALNMFLPEVTELEKTIQTLHLLEKPAFLAAHGSSSPSATTLVAALFSFIDEDPESRAFKTCKSLYFHQFPKNHKAFTDCKSALWMVEKMRMFEEHDPASLRPSEFEHMFCNERGRELLLLMHAVQVASGKHSIARERLHTARRILTQMMATICPDGETHLPHLISGNDLKALGIPEGPQYRELKNTVRDAQLTHRICTKEEAMDLVQKQINS